MKTKPKLQTTVFIHGMRLTKTESKVIPGDPVRQKEYLKYTAKQIEELFINQN